MDQSVAITKVHLSRLSKRILRPINRNPGKWDISGGRTSKIYNDRKKLFLLTSRDKWRVEQARELLKQRIGETDVESSATMLRYLSDSENGAFANGTGKYILTVLCSGDKVIAARNVVSWPEMGVVQNTLIAVDKAHENRGYARLMTAENLILGIQGLGEAEWRFVFSELEPGNDFGKIVGILGKDNAYALDMPYPLPPLHENGQVSSLVPTFFVVSEDTLLEVGGGKRINDEEAKGILSYIHEGFYGTGKYIEHVFEEFKHRIRNNSILMKPLDTRDAQQAVLVHVRSTQQYFDIKWPAKN
ncbi:MAG: hypothetical protein ABIG39_00755 [Candidatus Micrarchaeota archaeon]